MRNVDIDNINFTVKFNINVKNMNIELCSEVDNSLNL